MLCLLFVHVTFLSLITKQIINMNDILYNNPMILNLYNGSYLQISCKFIMELEDFITNQKNIYRVTPVHYLQKAEKKT